MAWRSCCRAETALAFVRGDTAQAAKAISTFNREHEILTYKGGFMDTTSLDPEGFKSIALLPSRDVLDGQFAGVVASPLTGMVRGLGPDLRPCLPAPADADAGAGQRRGRP